MLVYVPHTTAAVTINEKIDPVLVADLERGVRADRRRRLGLASRRRRRAERAVARPRLGRGRAGADPAPRRRARRSAATRRSSSASSTGRSRARCTSPSCSRRRRPLLGAAGCGRMRLELRLPDEEELRALAWRVARGGSPSAGDDAVPGRLDGRGRRSRASSSDSSSSTWRMRRAGAPERLVARPRRLGTATSRSGCQGISGERFDRDAPRRDRLVARAALPGPRLRHRDARLRCSSSAFAGLGAERARSRGDVDGNTASARVSDKLGYDAGRRGVRRAARVPEPRLQLELHAIAGSRRTNPGRGRRARVRPDAVRALARAPASSRPAVRLEFAPRPSPTAGRWPRRCSATRSSSSRSTRSPSAGTASRGSTASSSSCGAGLPGDTVRARVTKVQRRHAEAITTEVLEAGPAAGRGAVRALPGLRRLPLPGSRLRRAARGEARLGRGLAPADRRASPSRRSSRSSRAEEVFGYRNKMEYSFAPGPDGGPTLGLHRAGRWDEVLEIERCWLTTDLGNAIRNAIRDWAREERLEAYDQATAQGLPPPPRRPRGPQHRPGARPARHARARALRPRAADRGADARSPRCGRSTGRSTTRRPR